ncbi:MAG: UPF0164 family protein [FCB group bacterium]|nr:UPF0164 family protein [FCB group bacterium]
MKKITLTIAIFVGLLTAQFDNVGTSAANFLKIGVGGRAEGMGGAFVAQVKDASALFWNPAGLAHITRPQIQFNNTDWIYDVKHQFLALAAPLGKGSSIGLSISYLTMGEMLETTELEPDGTGRKISASDVAIGLGLARKVSNRFSVGIQAKLIRETISFSTANAVAIDAGSQYITNFSNLTIGMSISNFGSKMRLFGTDQLVDVDIDPNLDANPQVTGRLDTKDWPLPMVFRFGISITPIGRGQFIDNKLLETTINVEYLDPRDFNPYYIVGSEVKILDVLYLRGGLQYKFLKYDDALNESSSIEDLTKEKGYVKALAWGFGLDSESFPFIPYKFQVDYSFSDMGLLNMVSRLTFTLSL